MNKQLNTNRGCFRFRTSKGQWLTDKIAYIEASATKCLREGVSLHSVQTGSLALLKMALEGVSGELVQPPAEPTRIPACTPASKRPRCMAPEG